MLTTRLTLAGFAVLNALPALAQTSTPAPTTPGGTAGAAAPATGIGDYWWLILLVIAAAAAAWYFTRGRRQL
jgi:type II secretory pathway component PulF